MLSITSAAVGAVAWYGCSIYDPSLLLPGAAEAGVDASSPKEAGVDAPAAETSVACPEDFPPKIPAADDPSDAGDIAFVSALHTLDFGIRVDGGPAPTYGYDLDSVYTCCDGGPSSCTPPVSGQHCDESGGRDNSGGELIASLALLDPTEFNFDTISQRLESGVYSLIIQITDYNGTPNDTQVVAAIYASAGITPTGDGSVPPAKWDGTDVWTIDEAFVLNSPDAGTIIPNHYDAHAYVSGGVLVMQVDFPISLGASNTSNITLVLSGGVISATITPHGDGTYSLENGVVAGRWTAPSVLGAVQGLTFEGNPMCPGSSIYNNVKQQICAAADIMTDPGSDNKGATCDALSVAFGFSSDPAIMGGVVSTAAKATLCGDGGVALDNCATP